MLDPEHFGEQDQQQTGNQDIAESHQEQPINPEQTDHETIVGLGEAALDNDNIMPIVAENNETLEAVADNEQNIVEKSGELGAETALSPEMAPKKELNEIQKQNAIVTESLLKHFPKAFIEGTTKDGRTYGILKDSFEITETTRERRKFICYNGIFDFAVRFFDGVDYQQSGIYASKLIEITRSYDFAPVLDEIDEKGHASGVDYVVKDHDFSKGYIVDRVNNSPDRHALSVEVFNHVDFSDPHLNLVALNKMFVESEKKHESDPIPNKLDTDGIIAALTMSENESQFK